MKKIHSYIININYYLLVPIAIFLNFCVSFGCNAIAHKIYGHSFIDKVHQFKSIQEQFIMAVLLAPLIETAIFQFIAVEILYEKLNKYVIVLISALLFASTHLYNFVYFIFAFVLGLLFVYIYFIGREKNRGFLLVFSIHFIYNLLVFILHNINK